MIIHLRRSVSLLLGAADEVGHSAIGDLVETALVNHAALYFRGMRVLNETVARRALPEDCGSCWSRFQLDLKPKGDAARAGEMGQWQVRGSRDQG